MICDEILAVQRRIRTARLAALDGQCMVARHVMARAGRDLGRVKADDAIATNPCARALAKGTSEFLAESRRKLRETCGRGGGR